MSDLPNALRVCVGIYGDRRAFVDVILYGLAFQHFFVAREGDNFETPGANTVLREYRRQYPAPSAMGTKMVASHWVI